VNPPRHDIRELVTAIIDIASRLDPDGVDAAIADIPGAWDIASITGERHGYGYHAILNCGASGYESVMGKGQSIAKAIRAASEEVQRRYPQ
jgi:hypothetical protein